MSIFIMIIIIFVGYFFVVVNVASTHIQKCQLSMLLYISYTFFVYKSHTII